MPTITFTLSTANATLLREALAHHQGVDVVDVTNNDVREYAGRHLRTIVQQYRSAKRDAENPVDESNPLA